MTDNAVDRQTLWVVTELYYPEETSTGYYLTRTAEDMTSLFNVRVICGQPNYSARGIRAPKHETRKGVEIFRAAGTTLNKNVIIYKLVNMVTLGIGIFFKGLLNFRQKDRILVVTTPPTLPFVTAIAALLRGAQYVLLIHDNYPEILFAAGKSKENGAFASMLTYCNRWLYKHASKIIVVGRDMEVLIKQKTKGLDIPIAVIQNWAELETVEPRPRSENTLLKELGLEDKFVFLYAGNMGYPNDIETVVECANRLKGDATIHFIFLGAGVKEMALRKSVNELGLANISLLAPKPRSEQIIFLNACDVALVSLVTKMRGVSMPSRTYNILAAGKPILALTEDDSELAMVIEEDQIGWHVPPGNADKLVSVIAEIYEKRGQLAEYGERSRASAISKYSLETASRKYIEALKF
ncbi:MAG: glycosyltransferase family 4 protein [Pyrinomonadaceae bacterium]|nr:glycosyltransferase family 4 protein [Acidobacteriota bacterium]MBK7935550.1 glycosyltransferase family 4 protein [Acidobacteriota bacterium]MBP7377233.1 glycosyltransferase family 4 protein [Pyrinomonadaceae bacterium]MBP9110673.1 glycosyltransferase family 4 protein [Pyrinomonadaceae bacterium]